ncbi:hypothetical protein SEA_THIMANN_61 [Gordonia phage Thimann]|uniref:Uncharacterized protein n=1 Tax=Gordonia phage Easley TaxID=2182395 RepID=A0A2U8UMT9_9CAUD|nr:hypothetical protein PP510_gp55 [Gordonia phage Easley]AWN05079.1 hypothetical protein SEA_EASLEY_55 [Gordonia phage Easley]WNM74324.1 hypothetical protein SEA_THIMANN_61 [Gordonia phage Thimann]
MTSLPKHRVGTPVDVTICRALLRDPVIVDAIDVSIRRVCAALVPVIGLDNACELAEQVATNGEWRKEIDHV